MLTIPTQPKSGATMRQVLDDENYIAWSRYQDSVAMKGGPIYD